MPNNTISFYPDYFCCQSAFHFSKANINFMTKQKINIDPPYSNAVTY